MTCSQKWSNLHFRTLRPVGIVFLVIRMWAGQEARGQEHCRGFPGYLNPSRHFLTISVLIPSKSRWKRFCYHLDIPSCKNCGFTYHSYLYLTYFRSCVCGLLKQRLDTAFRGTEYSPHASCTCLCDGDRLQSSVASLWLLGWPHSEKP